MTIQEQNWEYINMSEAINDRSKIENRINEKLIEIDDVMHAIGNQLCLVFCC
jgi:hypothetical protein